MVVLTLPAAAARADDQPNDVTPAGPASLMNLWTGPVAAGFAGNVVLTAWKVDVGPGGNGGPVKLRVLPDDGSTATVGDAVDLPAAPGTYTFPAPHVDGASFRLGIDQSVGGHAIVHRSPCTPQLGARNDLCQLQFIVETAGGTTTNDGGAELTLTPVTEPDADHDLRGDQTEDRTDLRIGAYHRFVGADKVQFVIAVTNAGPLSADLPVVTATLPIESSVPLQWSGCTPASTSPTSRTCSLPAIRAGATGTATLTMRPEDAGAFALSASSEGPDLKPDDNATNVTTARDPSIALTVGATQYLRHGVTISLHSEAPGRARVAIAVKIHGRTLRISRSATIATSDRALTIHPQGAALRSLRRAAREKKLPATITVTSGARTTHAAFSLKP